MRCFAVFGLNASLLNLHGFAIVTDSDYWHIYYTLSAFYFY